MTDKKTWHEEDRPPMEVTETHVALCLVLDVSGSMNEDGKLQALNDAVNQMAREMASESRLKNVVDLSIITFSGKGAHNVYMGWCPVGQAPPVALTAAGTTYIEDAIDEALRMVIDRCHEYEKYTPCYKPWMVILSDGEIFDDVNAAGARVRDRVYSDKLHCFALGVGQYRKDQLQKFTDLVYDVKTYNLKEFFSWVGQSMKAISSSAPGEKISLPPLEFTA